MTDAATRDRLLQGDTDPYDVAPGWPHDDSAAGMSFLNHGGVVYLVLDSDGRIVGECGTKSAVDANGSVEIGYGLAAPSRGRRLGTAVVSALIDTLRSDRAVRLVEAEVHQSNDPSRRILERLGFRETGAAIHGFRRYILDLED